MTGLYSEGQPPCSCTGAVFFVLTAPVGMVGYCGTDRSPSDRTLSIGPAVSVFPNEMKHSFRTDPLFPR